MKPAFNFEFSRDRIASCRDDMALPEWLAIRPPADGDDDAADQRAALGLAIALVSSLMFWAGVGIVLFKVM